MKNFRDLLDKMRPQIEMALPRHITAERIVRVTHTAMQRTPELLECTPGSLMGAIMVSSQLGLEVNGPLNQSFLIPRKNGRTGNKEANFQMGWRGLRDLVFRSGAVTRLYSHCVYRMDRFDLDYGTDKHLRHTPYDDGDRGPLRGIYAVAHLRDADPEFVYMTEEEILTHRDKYCQKPRYGDWVWETEFEKMGQKTTVIQLARWLPMSIEMQYAINMDAKGDRGEAIDVTDTTDFAELMAESSEPEASEAPPGKEDPEVAELRESVRVKMADAPAGVFEAAFEKIGMKDASLDDLNESQLRLVSKAVAEA